MTDQPTKDSGSPAGLPIQASIKLDEPIMQGANKIDRVVVRRPNPGEMEGLSLRDVMNLDVAAATVLLTRITQPPLMRHELAAMDPADFTTLAVELSNFLFPKSARHPPLTE